MTNRAQIFCAVCGPIALLLFLLVLWPAAHFLPPPSPSLGTEEVAALYRNNATGIKIAAILQIFSIMFLVTFYAGISAQLRRIERGDPTWTYVQLAAGTLSLAPFIPVALFWAAAAFRPDRAPEVIQSLNDLSFLFLVSPAPPATIQLIAVGMAILGDKNPNPLFPRWLAYVSFWAAILILPGVLVVLFAKGPFAWNGILAFWAPAIIFGLWVNIMQFAMIKAAKRPAPPPLPA